MKRAVLRLILALAMLPAANAQNIILPMAGGNHATPAPAVTDLSFDQNAVAGGYFPTGTVTLNVAATSPGGSKVALKSDNSAVLVPSTVTVAAGDTSATFTATTSVVTSQQVATVTATLNGAVQATVTVAMPAVTGLSFDADAVAGGYSPTGTVTLNVAAPSPGGITVALNSDNGVVQVPSNVIVPAGQTSATFTATTSVVTSQQVATVTATLNGTAQATVTVAMPEVTGLSFDQYAVAGGYNPTGTVTLNVAAMSPDGSTVALNSDNGVVQVPPSVIVPAGQTSVTFTATTSAVVSQQVANVTATLNGTAKATLTVDLPVVTSLSFSPDAEWGGDFSTGTVTLNVAAASPDGTTVALSSDNATVQPGTDVTVPAGQTSVTFAAATSPVASEQVATVTATLNGTAQATLTVDPPAIANLSFNPGTVGGGSFSTGTLTLSVPALTPGGSTVALSSNNGAVQVETNVTVPAGHTSATFTAAISSVASQQIAIVTATLNGTAQGTLTVDPPSATPHYVTLTWTASTSFDVFGYNIYRSTTSYADAVSNSPVYSARFVRAFFACVSTVCTFNDDDYRVSDLADGTTYYYVVTAVDRFDIESTNADADQQASALIQ